MTRDQQYLIECAIRECEIAAKWQRSQTPEMLRAWAGRIESNIAPNSVSLVAMGLDRAATWLGEALSQPAITPPPY